MYNYKPLLSLVLSASIAWYWLPIPSAAQEQRNSSMRFSFRGGAQVVVKSPKAFESSGVKLATVIEDTHAMLERTLGELPQFSTTLRLMESDQFYADTGAPSWTNALFYRGQIIIPVSEDSSSKYDSLARSIKHEYVHAALHALSDGRCPGWLDEGLAQWWEGDESPLLRPALSKWLARNKPVPFVLLQGGFTQLDDKMVAPAYAQSLIASTSLSRTYGFPALRRYLDRLRNGEDKGQAFIKAFGIPEDKFEERLGRALTSWSAGHSGAPRGQRVHNPQVHPRPHHQAFRKARL